jgi:ribosomal protein S18 acetylase RimI-like enzyme
MSAPPCDAAPGQAAEATQPARVAAPLCHVLRDASSADEAALAALYTAALEYNPAFDSVFERRRDDPVGHADALLWLFHRRVALLLSAKAHYLVAVDEHTGLLLGGAAIVPRARAKASVFDMIRVGLLEWPFRFGLPSLLRALSRNTLPPDPPGAAPFEGLVSTVAVAPEAQGRGIGSALLRALLARWDAAGGGALALDTQRERNVPFYERHGFRVTQTLTPVGAHGVEYSDWKMRREAVPPAAPLTAA